MSLCTPDCDDRAERLEGELRGLSAENQRLRTEREVLKSQVATLKAERAGLLSREVADSMLKEASRWLDERARTNGVPAKK